MIEAKYWDHSGVPGFLMLSGPIFRLILFEYTTKIEETGTVVGPISLCSELSQVRDGAANDYFSDTSR